MSGRRAAENTNTTRCIWLTDTELDFDGREDDETNLWRIYQLVCAKHAAAPADPAEAVRIACLTSLDGFVSPAHIGQVHAAVLMALGLRRQDNPTPLGLGIGSELDPDVQAAPDPDGAP